MDYIGNTAWHIKRSFRVRLEPNISLIIPTHRSDVWIYGESYKFHNVNSTGTIDNILNVDFAVDHAAIQGNDFIVSSSDWLSIKRVSEFGSVKTEMTSSPLFPLGLHVCDNGDILVCFVDKYDFSINSKSRRFVMVYHSHGLLSTEIEFTRGERIFTIPFRVTSCKKDIVVIDMQSKTRSRILSITRGGKIVFEFSKWGHFCPSDIASGVNRDIFVLDENSQSILILNDTGGHTSTIYLSEYNIKYPLTMAFDKSSVELWVGHSNNNVTILGNDYENDVKSTSQQEEIINNRNEETWL